MLSLAWIPMFAFGVGYVLISSTQKKADMLMMIGTSILGFCFDSLLIAGGVFSTPAEDSFSPFLVGEYVDRFFNCFFSMGLYEIRNMNWFVIVIVAAFGGLSSYRAGGGFGGIVFHEDLYFLRYPSCLNGVLHFQYCSMMYEKITKYVNER